MYYYSISYITIPPRIPQEIQKEVGDDCKMIFLFGSTDKLDGDDFQFALESYLRDNNIFYNELTITEAKEITEQECVDRTQYK
jgi:hypothetical protein